MKRPIIVGLLFGVPSGAFVGVSYSDDTATNVVAGIVFGIVATLAIGAYVVRSDRKWKQRLARVLEEFEPEGIVHHSDAALGSRLRGSLLGPVLRDTGGWLVLTKRRLVFIPHQHNFRGKRTELAINEIASAWQGGGISPNTITVVTPTKHSVPITVRGPDEWLAKLPGAKSA